MNGRIEVWIAYTPDDEEDRVRFLSSITEQGAEIIEVHDA